MHSFPCIHSLKMRQPYFIRVHPQCLGNVSTKMDCVTFKVPKRYAGPKGMRYKHCNVSQTFNRIVLKEKKNYGWCDSFKQSNTAFPDSNEDFPLTFSLTFSKEEGETTEKQTKKTSVCG